MHLILKIGISRNTECVNTVGFPKLGHIYIYIYIYIYISYIAVAMYNRDRYEIIGLCEISHFIKQPCKNVCLEKAL